MLVILVYNIWPDSQKVEERWIFQILHNVRPGETDFWGVIKRLKEKNNPVKYLGKEYIEFIKNGWMKD